MSTQSSIVKVSNKASDIWKVISDVTTPETWIPFLDSRRLTSAQMPDLVYYPSHMAAICQDRISVEVINCDEQSMSVELAMSFDAILIVLSAAIHQSDKATLLEVTANCDIPIEYLPEIDEVLSGVCEQITLNATIVCKALYPVVEGVKVPQPQQPTLLAQRHPEISVEPIKRVNTAQGIEAAMKSSSPVILQDFGSTLANYQQIKDKDWWRTHFGSQTVDFMSFANLAYDSHSDRAMTTLSTLLAMIEANPNAMRLASYENEISNLLGLYPHLLPPAVIPADCPTINQNFWIGSAHVKSPMHQDGRMTESTGKAPNKMHNVNHQVAGRKHAIIAHPDQTEHLYAKSTSLHEDRFPEVEIDFFADVDLERYPNVKNAKMFEAILAPGELLYIPRGWWHAFYALEDSINHNVFFSSHQY